MAKPTTKQELIDFCLRKLGAPVLEVNVDDDQLDDLVDDAIQLFNERHFDGVERMYLKYKLTQDDIDRGKANNKDGSASYIKDVGIGDLRIQGAADVVIENTSGANSAVFNTDGSVELYWRGSGAGKKLETTQTGAVVTGILTATELSGAIDGGSY